MAEKVNLGKLSADEIKVIFLFVKKAIDGLKKNYGGYNRLLQYVLWDLYKKKLAPALLCQEAKKITLSLIEAQAVHLAISEFYDHKLDDYSTVVLMEVLQKIDRAKHELISGK